MNYQALLMSAQCVSEAVQPYDDLLILAPYNRQAIKYDITLKDLHHISTAIALKNKSHARQTL